MADVVAGEGGIDYAKMIEAQKGFDSMASSVGIVERKMAGLSGAIKGMPFVKMLYSMKAYGNSTKRTLNHTGKWLQMSTKKKKAAKKEMTIMQKLLVPMIAYSQIGKNMNKITKKSNTLLGRFTSRMVGLFSIFLVIGFALAAVSLAFDGMNSPIAQATKDIPILSNVVNGLILVLHGEDGSTGLKGALDIIMASVVVFAVVWVAFGSSMAVIVAAAFLVVGTFQLVEKATGDSKIALLAAAAVFVLVGSGLLYFFGFMAAATIGAFMLPIALIMMAGAIFWAVITGKAPGWLAWVAGFMVTLALIILLPVTWPFILLAVAVGFGLAIIALFLRNRDTIVAKLRTMTSGVKAWWTTNKSKILTIAAWILFFPVMLGITLGKKIREFITKNKETIRGGFNGVVRTVLGIGRGFVAKINNGVKFITGLPGRLKQRVLEGVRSLLVNVISYYNNFARAMGTIKIPDWIPVVGGKSFRLPTINVPALAEGGIVNSPTLALIGESGPEAVVPLGKGGGMGNTFNINIDVSGMTDRSDKRAFAMQISDEIQKEMRRYGRGTTRRGY